MIKIPTLTCVVTFWLLSTGMLSQGYEQIEFSTEITWKEVFMTQMGDDSLLVLGCDESTWEFVTLIPRKNQFQNQLMSVRGATPSIIINTIQGPIIGGSAGDEPAIWRYNENQLSEIKLPVAFSEGSEIVDLIEFDKHVLILVGSLAHFSFYQLNLENNELDSIQEIVKRTKDEFALIKKNQFAETYLVRSCPKSGHQNPIAIRKYDEENALLWEKEYPGINGIVTGLIIHPNGDLLGTGITGRSLQSHTFFARWAPNGSIISLVEENSLDKSLKRQIGWINASTFWSIGDVIPFGARFPDIEIKQYSVVNLEVTGQNQISGKAIERQLANTVDKLGNVSILYKKGHNNSIYLKYIAFNQDPCTRPLDAESIMVTYYSPPAPNITTDRFEFAAYIKTQNQLSPSDIRIQALTSGAKAPEPTNLVLINSDDNDYCYKITKRLFLQQGENNIRVVVNGDHETFTDTLSIFHVVKRPNLYIFSVGVVYEDLSFTGKDAADFVSLFTDQEGRLFEKVTYDLLNTREETKAISIINKLEDFSQLPIEDEDLVFVFFSSHGDLINQDFSILGSNYDFEDPATMVHFKQEIIRRISKIKGKKVLFLDACKSGNLKGKGEQPSLELVSTIFKVVASTPGILAISSSTDQQSSYEVNDLQNGIFTAAIKQLFLQNPKVSDLNSDQVITIGELYQYLGQRVPELIKQYFKDPNRQQNPTMPLEEIDRELPIYYISKSQL
ncbi:MAG: caspase family protein [Saprospiraceae bacterium]|nr:caspase family protein [Saprospiraceae bacterium]